MATAEEEALQESAAKQTVSCREITGMDCDFVAQADGNHATVGYHVDQVMSLLGKHLAHVHRTGLDVHERNEIRMRFAQLP